MASPTVRRMASELSATSLPPQVLEGGTGEDGRACCSCALRKGASEAFCAEHIIKCAGLQLDCLHLSVHVSADAAQGSVPQLLQHLLLMLPHGMLLLAELPCLALHGLQAHMHAHAAV